MEVNAGEDHAAYKLMLFSCPRCPGAGACADPLIFRSQLQKIFDHRLLQTAELHPRYAEDAQDASIFQLEGAPIWYSSEYGGTNISSFTSLLGHWLTS